MKCVQAVLFGLLVSLAVSQQSEQEPQNQDDSQYQIPGPWQQGKLYKYDVQSKTFANLKEGSSSGSVTKARFLVKVLSQERLQAKLEGVKHAQVHQELNKYQLPDNVKYEPVKGFEDSFEIIVKSGRVVSLNLPSSFNLNNENLVKALVSALQVDLTPHRKRHQSQDYFDKESYQGQYRKMETDVTGDCETLYTVSPFPKARRHELPKIASNDETIEITKTRNYGKCNHRVAYHFGVPVSAEWTGAAHDTNEYQLMKRNTFYQIQAGKQGPIYKSKAISTVQVSPLMRGNQKAEVYSEVKLELVSYEDDSQAQWPMSENMRQAKNLLFSMISKSANINEYSSTSSESESSEWSEQNELSHEEQDKAERIRRSPKFGPSYRAVAINKVVIRDHPWIWDKSTSSSSSSDSSSGYVNDEAPKSNEPAYAALYMSPQQRADNKQSPVAALKLVQEIAQQLNNPNTMPKVDTLSRFNILIRLIASMNSEQLAQTTRGIESAKVSNSIIKSDMWMVYRDAVTQSGTMPAFQQIKTWIQSKKLRGEEAAQVVASLATSLRYPTKDQMTQFFNLAISEEVSQQRYLNSTALIAATRFINNGHVDEKMASANYPTQMYGRLTKKHDNFVEKEILPRLQQEMEKAIKEGDSHKAQVMIKAIGNLGHRATLGAFEPYLSGREQVSSYLRRFMVQNLDVLAYQGDHYVRAALYSILRNTAEPNEVRLAAIQNIFMAGPTLGMMQTMAAMTNDDASWNVRAAIKSSIETAAELKNLRFFKLARTAQAAKDMLTKEDLSPFYSSKFYYNAHDRSQELDIFTVLSYISSENSLLPKNLKYTWATKPQSWHKKNAISASLSNPRQFAEYFQEQMNRALGREPQRDQKSSPNHKYSPEKIAEMLNIKRDPESPVEAAFAFELMGQQRFLAISEDDMQRLPFQVQNALEKLANGVDYHYTKVLNQAHVSIMFPLASGVPFIFKYKEPTLVHIQGKAKAQVQASTGKPYSVSLDKEMQLTFARNLDGSVGFLDTLTNFYSSVGVVSKIQVHIPIKAQVKYESNKVKVHLQPLNPEQDTTIAHMSVWPYSASQKKDSHVTISLDPTTKVISRNNKVSNVDAKFGQPTTGTQFQLQGYSQSTDYRNAAWFFYGNDLLKKVAFFGQHRDVALTHYNLRYLGKQSPNKGAVTITAAFDSRNRKPESPMPTTPVQDSAPDSEARRNDMLDRVSRDLKAPKAYIVDLSATFEGPQKAEYVLSAAISDSDVDPKTKYSVFASRNNAKLGNTRANVEGLVTRSETGVYDLKKLLSQEAKTTFEADITFGQTDNSKARIEGSLLRSQKAAEDFEKTPVAQQCFEQMARNNQFQPACHKAYIRAQAPDQFKAIVSYKDISPAVKNMTYQAYRMARHLGYSYTEENVMRNAADGKLEVEAELSYEAQTMNANLFSRAGDLRISNAPIPKYTAALLSPYHYTISESERVANFFTKNQYLSYCTVDGNMIKTFSNRTYGFQMTNSWYVLMLDDARYAGKQQHNQDRLAVLARRPDEKQMEVYISYRSSSGKDLEIRMKPAPIESKEKGVVTVSSDLKTKTEDGVSIMWDEAKDKPVLMYYALPDGVIFIDIDDRRYRAVYDGQRLVISGQNRNNSHGLCGNMNGEPNNDNRTPYGIVDSSAEYAAAFNLNAESNPESNRLQGDAKKHAYEGRQQYTSILRSDPEWRQFNKRSENKAVMKGIYRARNYKSGPCKLDQQVQFFEENSQICISTTPVPSCSSKCRGDGYKVQAAQVICRSYADQDFRMYRDQIRQGKNPQVSGVPQPKQFRVPNACIE